MKKIIFLTVIAFIFLAGCTNRAYNTLQESVKHDDIDLAEYYIKKSKADPDSADENGLTPLIHAVKNVNEDMVEMLIENGSGVNKADSIGATPLIYAAKYADEDIVEILIENGSNINHQDSMGRTALMAAAAYDNIDIAEELIDAEADLNLAQKDGMTALMFAIQYDHKDMVTLLKDEGATTTRDINSSKNAQLLLAAEMGKIELVKSLLKENVDVNARYYNALSTPLIESVRKENSQIVKLLLEAGADVNIEDVNNKKAMAYALESKNAEIVQMLEKAAVLLKTNK